MQSSVYIVQIIRFPQEIVENKYFGRAELLSSGWCAYSSQIVEVITTSVSHLNPGVKPCPLFLQPSSSSSCMATCTFFVNFF